MNTDLFSLGKYTITSSLGERGIYLKFIDQINFVTYDGNLDAKELRLQFELSDIYKLIEQTFAEEEGYTVSITISNGFMKLAFNAFVGGFLKVYFEAMLKEKIMSNDGQLTLNMNKMEQKLARLWEKLDSLEEVMKEKNEENLHLIDAVSNAVINISRDGINNYREQHFIKINSKEVTISDNDSNTAPIDLSKLQYLYKLEKLIITYFRTTSMHSLSNKNVKELEINCANEGHLTSLTGIEKCPNLVKLTITNAPALTAVVSILSSVKHTIKTFTFTNCTAINVVELQTYCQVNKFQLNIS
jgi:hypothetical protein